MVKSSSFGCRISWLQNIVAVEYRGCRISWLQNIVAAEYCGCRISYIRKIYMYSIEARWEGPCWMWKTEHQLYVEDWISNISDIQSSTFNMVFLIWLRYCPYIFFLYMIFCSHDILQPRETKCETKSLWRISFDHHKVTSLSLNAIQFSPFGIQLSPFGIQSFPIRQSIFPHSAVSLPHLAFSVLHSV